MKEVRERDADTTSYVAEEASTATRTETPIEDIPQSIQVVTRKVIDDQKAIRIEQALRNVSGVFLADNSNGTNDAKLARDYFKNGVRNDSVTKYVYLARLLISKDCKPDYLASSINQSQPCLSMRMSSVLFNLQQMLGRCFLHKSPLIRRRELNTKLA